ncbi:disease resistance protein RPV1-like [Rhododendron vialii]|uniref:disease resistance protein RPV1-like n=1 Tax=Rhododendron vialii TaxID=182163 RepID=UPI00265F0B9D|nr:disease resistance protein RPV1-like [Rhododendron vialii]
MAVTGCAYDVFLSFRGKDTGKTFTDHLYVALVQAGCHTFRDDDEIVRGEDIKLELQKAIEQSRISVVVFSKTYACSGWCLDELVKILHRKKTSRHEVLPIFYDMDPSDVRKQTGSFAEAFTRHEMWLGSETIERNDEWMKKLEHWRAALRDVSNLAAMVLQNEFDGHEAKFIQKIVNVIRDKLNRRDLSISPFLVGILPGVRIINLWMQDGAMDASMIAICGMGGIGKTTIAKSVYNLNRENFDGSSFLANIRQRSQEPNGLVKLQQQLISDIGKEQKLSCVDEGIIKIADAISCKRLLLVLDDVDQVDQLHAVLGIHAVLGMRRLFSPGSKIIITTRHKRLLNPNEVDHEVHQLSPLNNEDSLELFSLHAFGQAHPIDNFLDYAMRVVHYCGGLPLALQVLGSSLSGRSVDVWVSALKKLEAIPDGQILRTLMISYDCLQDDHDKELFLHIACFFVGRDRDWTINILDECGLYTTIGIENLKDRCLLTVDGRNNLEMHKLLQDMGREIVQQESPKVLGSRTRLWRDNDSFKVLREKSGTYKIEGLILDMHKIESSVDGGKSNKDGETLDKTSARNSNTSKLVVIDAFSEMDNLKLLQLNYVQISGPFKKFPNKLRWLCWHGFPLKTIPSDFPMGSLVALDLQYSNFKRVWEGTKFCKTLKILDLSHSQELTITPDFSGVPNLKELILEECVNLVKIHESIEKLESLILLNLEDCKNLKKLPHNICMLKSLKTLIISGCSNLDWWPTEGRKIGSLKVIHNYEDRVKRSAFEVVKSWQGIIRSCILKPRKNPDISYFQFPRSLVKLSLAGSNLFNDDFPLDFSNMPLLEYLDLSANNICSLPESVRDLTGLRKLLVDSCKRLTSLTGVSNVRLERLSVKECPSLQKVSYQSTLSGPLTIFCRDCGNLVEIEGHFKFESMSTADVENLKAWGFSYVEAFVPWYIMSASDYERVKWLSSQKLFEGGVFSYFLPGDEIPSVFSIKANGSSLSFLVPSRAHYEIQGFVICCIYTTWKNTLSDIDFLAPLTTMIDNKTKHVKCEHCPVSIGIPKANENMIWISHWNSRDLLDGGDEVVVSVNPMESYVGLTQEEGRCIFEVKEVGVIFLYERQGEIATHETFAYKDMVPGDLSLQEMLYSIGGRNVRRRKRHSSGGPHTLTRGL